MTRAISRIAITAAVLCVTAVVLPAQQTTVQETKTFEVLALYGNQLVVRLPEGTREITVPDDFRFNINGQMMSVQQLRVGMKGTATITTRTTVTPVTVTEIKNGQVVARGGGTIIVRTDGDVKSFTQGDVDKRGVKIWKDGKPAQVSDFREGDVLSATIITSQPPHIATQQEVQATLAAAPAPGGVAGARSQPAPAQSGSGQSAAARPAPAAAPAAQSSSATSSSSGSRSQAEAAPKTLPATASSLPLLGLTSGLLLALGFALTIGRRFVR